jgi:hypothetical protein
MDLLAVIKRLLYPQFLVQVEEGDLDAALLTLRTIVYTERPLAEGPLLLGALVAAASHVYLAEGVERVLARGEPSDASLDATRRLLEAEIARPLLLAAFRGERAMVEDVIRALDEGRVSRDDVAKSQFFANPPPQTGYSEVDRVLNRLAGTDFSRANAVARLRHFTWLVERLKESPDGLLEHADEWAVLRSQLPRGVKALMDMMVHYATDGGVDEVRLRCAVVALAAEQFRRAHGCWPTNLGDLVPRYLTAVPRDPFDRQPLKLARRSDGLVIYSIGKDGRDDGGDVERGPGRGRDVGIRLWDVNQRRQLAPPTPASNAASTAKRGH